VVFEQLLDVQGMVVGDVTVRADPDDDGEILVVSVGPKPGPLAGARSGRRLCPGYTLVSNVPKARAGEKCTYLLEDTCAWLAKEHGTEAVTVFLRLSWRTVARSSPGVVQDLTERPPIEGQ